MTESNSTLPLRTKSWNKWGTAMVISLSIALIALVFGLLGTVVGMVGAFNELNEDSLADPEALSGDIHTALVTTAGGIVVSVIGFILAIVFLILFLVKKDRDKKAAALEIASAVNQG